jgi:hypothetical protein
MFMSELVDDIQGIKASIVCDYLGNGFERLGEHVHH